MAIFRNVASQVIEFLAWDVAAQAPKTGDATNISCKIAKDHGAAAAATNTVSEASATDLPGLYRLTLAAAETDCAHAVVYPKSSTSNVVIEPVQFYTVTPPAEPVPRVVAGLKRGVAVVVPIYLTDLQTGALVTSPTIAAGDFKVSVDGAALANLATLPSESPVGSGIVNMSLSAGEMTGSRIAVLWRDADSGQWRSGGLVLMTTVVNVDDLVRSTVPANTLDVSATGEAGLDFANVKVPGAPLDLSDVTVGAAEATIGGFEDGAITADAIAPGALTKDKFNSNFWPEIWAVAASLCHSENSIGAEIIAYFADIIGRLGLWTGGAYQDTVKHALDAIANHSKAKPSGWSDFSSARDALSKIGAVALANTNNASVLSTILGTVCDLSGEVTWANVELNFDDAAAKDEYTVTFQLNDDTAHLDAAYIVAWRRSDGAMVIEEQAMSSAGVGTFSYKFDATSSQRCAAGETLIVKVTGTKTEGGQEYSYPWWVVRGRHASLS